MCELHPRKAANGKKYAGILGAKSQRQHVLRFEGKLEKVSFPRQRLRRRLRGEDKAGTPVTTQMT